MPVIEKLKRNLIPTLAVLIVPFGYFYGIQLRENRDARAMASQLEQQSVEERIEHLRRQRETLLEEREAILEKLQHQQNKN